MEIEGCFDRFAIGAGAHRRRSAERLLDRVTELVGEIKEK
jgi:hypothetical protein